MTSAGQIVELARYHIPAGQRALKAQRIDGRVRFLPRSRVVVAALTGA